jgi:hypothetical protein
LLQNASRNPHVFLYTLRLLKAFAPTLKMKRFGYSGRHTTAAMQSVAKKMDQIVEIGKAQNWTQSQYKAELRSMLAEQRQNLRAGNVVLNTKARPWAR